METEEYYKKVEIKSEEDLPTLKGEYYCHTKTGDSLLVFKRSAGSDVEFETSVWMRNVDWYLILVNLEK